MTWMIVGILVVAAIVIAALLLGDRFRYRLVRLRQDGAFSRRRLRRMAGR